MSTHTSKVSNETEMVTAPSVHTAAETVARLKSLLTKKGIEVFADVNHSTAARHVGMDLRPTQVVIFGNPRAGTPLMQVQQTMGLDLPLRILIWEDESGKVWLTYRRVETLAQRHRVVGQDAAIQALDAGLAALAQEAGR